jgi:hypothetical protein
MTALLDPAPDLGDVWSHYCTLNEEGEVIDRGRFRTSPKGVEKWFIDVPPARVAMEAGTHSIWISEHLQELSHEVIVANVREDGSGDLESSKIVHQGRPFLSICKNPANRKVV